MSRRKLQPTADRGPLRVLFATTSMPVGGAETLLVNLIRRMDRDRFAPELCCLKEPGPLADALADEIPVHSRLLSHKYDLRVLGRLGRLLARRRVDALVTVGAGDKMFWGRLAAWRSAVAVLLSALHSTGWPDAIGRLNRLLTPLTDGFIAVARPHARHLVEVERLPARKVFLIPNGVDVNAFQYSALGRRGVRAELGIPYDAPVAGIVAALRLEKNHLLFLRAAALVRRQLGAAHFVIVGDGPERGKLEQAAHGSGLAGCVHFLGTRSDIPQVLSALDLFALVSHNEANPVSILEAMAAGLPVVATDVGSVSESVRHGETGLLTKPGDANQIAACWRELFSDPQRARQLGAAGRQRVVQHGSLEAMVRGYENLIQEIYDSKCGRRPGGERQPQPAPTLAR